MELIQITPAVWQLPFPVGHAHIVRLPDGYGLIDTGVPGSAPAILEALDQLGGRPQDVRQIVLTHFHGDHMGSAADLVAATGARVLAGALDTPFIRGTAPEPEPVFTAPERALYEQIMAGFADAGGLYGQRWIFEKEVTPDDRSDRAGGGRGGSAAVRVGAGRSGRSADQSAGGPGQGRRDQADGPGWSAAAAHEEDPRVGLGR
uniref:MBL fold metallo-hydrolase n=1 Tax=Streptomyces sp. NBC_01001 TaxID=2903713 RepID=UPI002F9094AC|nr:MBL fold metallo-hydrolase [Streptomyces sp. NBC_01001]